MERLIEQPFGDGDILEGASYLGRVHYHLSIYQHFSDVEAEPVPQHLEIEGRITAATDVDVAELHRRRVELTLRLADGRVLDFCVVNREGGIRSTARGLQTDAQ